MDSHPCACNTPALMRSRLGSVSLEDFVSVQDLEADAFHVWTQPARRAIGE